MEVSFIPCIQGSICSLHFQHSLDMKDWCEKSILDSSARSIYSRYTVRTTKFPKTNCLPLLTALVFRLAFQLLPPVLVSLKSCLLLMVTKWRKEQNCSSSGCLVWLQQNMVTNKMSLGEFKGVCFWLWQSSPALKHFHFTHYNPSKGFTGKK